MATELEDGANGNGSGRAWYGASSDGGNGMQARGWWTTRMAMAADELRYGARGDGGAVMDGADRQMDGWMALLRMDGVA